MTSLLSPYPLADASKFLHSYCPKIAQSIHPPLCVIKGSYNDLNEDKESVWSTSHLWKVRNKFCDTSLNLCGVLLCCRRSSALLIPLCLTMTVWPLCISQTGTPLWISALWGEQNVMSRDVTLVSLMQRHSIHILKCRLQYLWFQSIPLHLFSHAFRLYPRQHFLYAVVGHIPPSEGHSGLCQAILWSQRGGVVSIGY